MTGWGFKWARCLPNRGTLLTHPGHAAYPSWARCLPLLGRIAVRRLSNKLKF